MLVNNFLKQKEYNTIIEWSLTKQLDLYVFGEKAYVYCFNECDFETLDNLFKKSHLLFLKYYSDFILDKNECYLFKLKSDGFFPLHTDNRIRLNILLKKPTDGGFIIDIDTKVIMQEKDAYILDATNQHGITTVKGNVDYLSLIISFNITR